MMDGKYHDKKPKPKRINDMNKLMKIEDFDIGATISEETQRRLKEIDDNIRNAMMNAHKFYVD